MTTLKKMRSTFVYLNQAYKVETVSNVEGKPTFLKVDISND